MSTSIWAAAAGTPTATHRIPVDTSAAGTPTMYTVQQIADLATSVGCSVNALGSISTNTAIDLSLGGFVSATITGNLTFTFTNPAAGGTEFTLVLANGGAFTITWPGSVAWAGATAPTLAASGTDVLRFTSGDGGTSWYGWHERDEPVSAGGSTAQLQFNNAGALGGLAGSVVDNTNRCITYGGATVTSSKPIFDLSQTWNATGVVMTGWKLNITNTASSASSKVFDLQVDGTSKVYLTPSFFRFGDVQFAINNSLFYTNGGAVPVCWRNEGPALPADGSLSWTVTNNNPAATRDTWLFRDAAGIIAQRNGTSAQSIRVYGTYTDASNYVRASLAATSTAVTLAAQTAGTGADNVPVILTPAGTSQVEIGNGVQFTEMTAPSAPATNKVILFAQDNGAGKTQLMALFASGAAQQVAIEP